MNTLSQSQIVPRLKRAFARRIKPRKRSDAGLRVVRIGLLGFGRVGSAVVNTCRRARDAAARRGLRLDVRAVLVRNALGRPAPDPRTCLTADADEFFRQPIDVVVEALGGVEPAARLVETALRRGLPVVSANKALLGERGPRLFELAETLGVPLYCEASVVAGVPFLGDLRARPFAARVRRIVGVLNGTSNFILSRIERDALSLEAALADARRRGLAEPDSGRDLSGADAADKLALLLLHVGLAGVQPDAIERSGLTTLEPLDIAAAKRFGYAIRPLAFAEIDGTHVTAFVGPGLVPLSHALAHVENESNGVELRGPEIGTVFHSGPGAGPDVTAATILDDVIEIAAHPGWRRAAGAPAVRAAPGAGRRGPDHPLDRSERLQIDAPATAWFVRTRLAAHADVATLREVLNPQGVSLRATGSIMDQPGGRVLHALTHPCRRDRLERALAALHAATGGTNLALRCLEDRA
ncbi:MAG: hypothetical protein CHACPFDD_01108 [Phycisphaerae bacterium]|nr:hypothetical protein [Phycisphaerae bacterium]